MIHNSPNYPRTCTLSPLHCATDHACGIYYTNSVNYSPMVAVNTQYISVQVRSTPRGSYALSNIDTSMHVLQL